MIPTKNILCSLSKFNAEVKKHHKLLFFKCPNEISEEPVVSIRCIIAITTPNSEFFLLF